MGKTKVDIKKAQYYVWYLGWKECKGLWGREFTEPIVKRLVFRRQTEELPKLTIEVSRKELKVLQLVEKKKGKVEKIKYPTIAAKDVTYAVQAMMPDDDVVACIYMGFNPQTNSAVHTHAYRCDSPETAAILAEHLNQIVLIPEHIERVKRIEQELVSKGQIVLRPSFVTASLDGMSSVAPTSDDGLTIRSQSVADGDDDEEFDPSKFVDGIPFPSDIDKIIQKKREGQYPEHPDTSDPVYDNLADELKRRLQDKKQAPLLLPPKDYDTVARHQGNMLGIEARKCLNEDLIGKEGVYKADNDSARGGSDGGSQNSRGSHGDRPRPNSQPLRNNPFRNNLENVLAQQHGFGDSPLQNAQNAQNRHSFGEPTQNRHSLGDTPVQERNRHAEIPGQQRSRHKVSPPESRKSNEDNPSPDSGIASPRWSNEDRRYVQGYRVMERDETTLNRPYKPGHPSLDRGNHGERRSNGSGSHHSGGSLEGSDPELMAITPRWKSGRDNYVPPSSPRATSPIGLRPSSPHLRSLSPGPELRRASYFPGGSALPNYLTSDNTGSREDIYSSGKKYTPSTLGLMEQKPGLKYGMDEGYRSMDRRDRPNGGRTYDDSRLYGNQRPGRPGGADMVTSMPALHQQYRDPMQPDFGMAGRSKPVRGGSKFK